MIGNTMENNISNIPADQHSRNNLEYADIVNMIPALRAFSWTFSQNSNDSDDLVQETLLKGMANLHQFRPGTSLKSWLFTIMRNTSYTRSRIYNREHPASEDCASTEQSSHPSQEWTIRKQEVSRSIQMLPYEQREVLILISMLGISYLDTAEICGCAMGTVKSRLNRARQNLSEMTQEQFSSETVRSGSSLYDWH